MSEIISLLKDYLILAIAVIFLLVLLYLIVYKLIYKKFLHRKGEVKFKSLIFPLIFIGYLVIVFGATFFSRSDNYFGNVSFNLFSSYKEAFITASLKNWRNIILNILLFIPIGILLPILNKKLKKPYISISIGFAITLFIETLQAIFHIGIFELDDILNNTLGTVIGYFLVNIIFILKNKEENKKVLKIILSLLPLVITIIAFTILLTLSSSQTFGYINAEYINRVNMKNVVIENKIENLKSDSNTATVYKSKLYSKDEVKEIAKNVFEATGSKLSETHSPLFYEQTAIFYTDDDKSIWIEYIGGTYNLNNNKTFTSSPDKIREDLSKEDAIHLLETAGITLKYDYTYEVDKQNNHIFKVDKIEDNNLVSGIIACNMKDSGNYSIKNNLITYEKVSECEIISENDAYKMLEDGKFKFPYDKLEKLEVLSIDLTYMLDTKAFYQPVYKFNVHINNSNEIQEIYIPAMK